jgi:ribose 5-phosphate isomerase A
VLDSDFGGIDDPTGLAADLSALPGVLEHGLFVGLADAIYVGTDEGATIREP